MCTVRSTEGLRKADLSSQVPRVASSLQTRSTYDTHRVFEWESTQSSSGDSARA